MVSLSPSAKRVTRTPPALRAVSIRSAVRLVVHFVPASIPLTCDCETWALSANLFCVRPALSLSRRTSSENRNRRLTTVTSPVSPTISIYPTFSLFRVSPCSAVPGGQDSGHGRSGTKAPGTPKTIRGEVADPMHRQPVDSDFRRHPRALRTDDHRNGRRPLHRSPGEPSGKR